MVSRRELLIAALTGALATRSRLTAAQGRRCLPLISGPLYWYDAAESVRMGTEGWREELHSQRRIGFSLLWLCGTAAALDSPERLAALRALMDLCARRKTRVILDTGSTGMWYAKLDLERELEVCGANVRRIGEEFAGHPAFFAWYVPQEIYMCWNEWADYIDALYSGLVERCKKAADLPVTVSPFFILDRDKVFGDFRYNEPEEYERYWARLIARSGFDIVMLQDSGEHFSYVTNDMRRPFFEAMSRACRTGGASLWGNVETAEYVCPSKEEYVRLYGKVHHSTAKGLPWRPAPIDRLKEKLDLAAEYSEDIVTWGYREFCRPVLGEVARAWYRDYLDYYRCLRAV